MPCEFAFTLYFQRKQVTTEKKYMGSFVIHALPLEAPKRVMICSSYTTAERAQFLSGKMTLTLPAHLQIHSAFIHISIVYY